MTAIDKVATYRNKRIKGNTQKRFDSKVLNARDKHCKKLKKPRLNIDKELYKNAKYDPRN